MKITLDPDLAVEAKALVALAFRNGPIEDLHAGKPCKVCSGNQEISHISDMMDADVVSETNCVRQPFAASDVGQNKATVLINRINLFWGTSWSANPNHFHAHFFDRTQDRCPDLVFGCVDTRAARKAIEDSFLRALSRTCYWLDLGNNASSGQFVLGQPLNARNRRKADRLRTASELFPEIVAVERGEDSLPSCSAVEALDWQEPFIRWAFSRETAVGMTAWWSLTLLSSTNLLLKERTPVPGASCCL